MEEGTQKVSKGRPRGKQEAIVTETRQMYRDGKPWSWKYKWPDKLAMKRNLTEKQVAFAHEYLVSQNASAAYRASKGTLSNPELRNDADRVNGNKMKKHEKIMGYLREKIMTEADELLDIQMDMIRDEDTPAAVRNDAIKDRLNRIWLKPEKEESSDLVGIWEVTITIKHKAPEVIEGVTVLDWDKEEDDTIIQSELWDDWEASWSTNSSDW